MRQAAGLLTIVVAGVLTCAGGAAARSLAGGCCFDAGLSASWNATAKKLTVSFTAPSGLQAGYLSASPTVGADGIIRNAPGGYTSWHDAAAYPSFGVSGGTYTLDIGWTPTADFNVQLEMGCSPPSTSCEGQYGVVSSNGYHAFSNPVLVHVAAAPATTTTANDHHNERRRNDDEE